VPGDIVRLSHLAKCGLQSVGVVRKADHAYMGIIHSKQQRSEPIVMKVAVAVHDGDKLDHDRVRRITHIICPADPTVHGAREELLPFISEQGAV
jgi:hypothetical protein